MIFVEDAMHATKAAVEEGIVAGGGVALVRAQAALDTLRMRVPSNGPTPISLHHRLYVF